MLLLHYSSPLQAQYFLLLLAVLSLSDMVVNDVHNLRLDVDVKRKNGMDMFLTTDAMDATAHEDELN